MKKIIALILILFIFFLTISFQNSEKKVDVKLYIINPQTPRGHDILVNIRLYYIDDDNNILNCILNETIDYYNEYRYPNIFSVLKKDKYCKVNITIYNKTDPYNIVISHWAIYPEIREEYWFYFWYREKYDPVLENWTGGIV